MKKAGTSGQESTVFILLEENEQVEPIDTLPLYQEVVKRKNQRARGHSTLLLTGQSYLLTGCISERSDDDMDSKEYKETMKKIEEAKKLNKEAHKLSLQAEALSVIALVINFITMLIHIIK